MNFLFRCFAVLASRCFLGFLEFANNLHSSHTCSPSATHFLIASSTALDRSPFFPPNLSITFNLSFLSRSFGISTQIRPILITKLVLMFYTIRMYWMFFQISKLQMLGVPPYFGYHLFCFKFAYSHIILCAYSLIKVLIYAHKYISD